ncbi:MAG: DUF4190 domain-containing protein [Nocardioidaceae bacterium]
MSDTSGSEDPPPYPGSGQPYPGSGQQPGPSGYPPPPPNSGQKGYPGYPDLPPGPPPNPYGSPPGAGYPAGPSFPAGPPSPGAYPGGYGDQEYHKPGWNGFAIAAFVVGLVLPLVGLLFALPFGIVALVKIGKSHQKGKGLAIAGIVASVLWWVGFIVLAVVLVTQQTERDSSGEITKAGRIDFGAIREGDCVSIPDPGGSGDVNTFDVKGVPCSETHNAETMAVVPIRGDAYPGQSQLDDQSLLPCQTATSGLVKAGYQPYRLLPTEGIWNGTDGHRVLCFVTKPGFADMTGSVSGN